MSTGLTRNQIQGQALHAANPLTRETAATHRADAERVRPFFLR